MNESMVFYRSFYEALRDLDDSIRLELYDAIMRYSLYEEEVELSPLAKPFFRLISPQLDANLRRRKNGTLGGRPSKDSDEKTIGYSEEKTIGYSEKNHRFSKQKTIGYANGKPNVNENANENGNANKYKRKNMFTEYTESPTDYKGLEKNIYAN
jgi:hypothetical protein